MEEEDFGEYLKVLRLKAGIATLAELGGLLADKGYVYEDSYLSHWQHGRKIPHTRKVLLALLEVFAERDKSLTITQCNRFFELAGLGNLTAEEREQLPLLNHSMVLRQSQPSSAQERSSPGPRQQAERLTWTDLRRLCQDITQRRTTTMRRKFRQKLYLPRAKTQHAFDRFLQSDKRCFALIGTSGIGKTSFLLAEASDLSGNRIDLGVLVYDGATISVQPSLTSFS